MGNEQDYYDTGQDTLDAASAAGLQPYQSPAAAELAATGRDGKMDAVYSNVMAIRSKTDSIPLAPMPYTQPMYGNEQSAYTDARVAYGGGVPAAMMYGVSAGTRTVVGGAYDGATRMMSDLGGVIRPITYTPPAHVYTGYSGRVMQHTGFVADAKAMLNIGGTPRATSPYLYGLNAAGDMGERMGLSLGGLATTAGVVGSSSVAGYLGGAALGLPGSIAMGLGAYAVAGYAADKVYEGVAARREIQDYLGRTSDQYVTSGSSVVDQRRGGGFNRGARRDVAEFVRGMDIKDPMLNTEDLTNILKGASELGMFTGIRETGDFKKKFKSIVENLKVVTTTLNQTLEEGLKTMKDLKGVGISEGQAADVSLRAQAMGRVAGRTASEMVNIGLQGAEIFRGTGVQMSIGFQANQMNLASIRASRDANMISQEAIAQAGGEEALAQRMTGTTMSFIQSDIGRASNAMYFRPGTGFDPRAFADANNRNLSMTDVALRAAGALDSPNKMIEYQVNQAKFVSDMGKSAGGRGLDVQMMSMAIAQAQQLNSTMGTDMNIGTRFALQQMGVDQSQIDVRMAELKNPQLHFENAQKAVRSTRDQQMADQAMNNFFLNRWSARAGDFISEQADIFAKPINTLVDKMGSAYEDWFDRNIAGVNRYDLNQVGIAGFDQAKKAESSRRAAGNSLDRMNELVEKGEIKKVNVELGGEAVKNLREEAKSIADKKKELESDLKNAKEPKAREAAVEALLSLDKNAGDLAKRITAAATGESVGSVTLEGVVSTRLAARGDKTLSAVFDSAERSENQRLIDLEGKRKDAEIARGLSMERRAKGGYASITTDLTEMEGLAARSEGEDLAEALEDVDESSVFSKIKLYNVRRGTTDGGVVLDTNTLGFYEKSLQRGDFERGADLARNYSMSPEQLAERAKSEIVTGIRSDIAGKLTPGVLRNAKNISELGEAVFGTAVMSDNQMAALMAETKGGRFEKQYASEHELAKKFMAAESASTVRDQQVNIGKIEGVMGELTAGGVVKTEKVQALLVKAMTESDATAKTQLLADAAAAAKGTVDQKLLEGKLWQGIEKRVMSARPGDKLHDTALEIESYYEQADMTRQREGAQVSVDSMRKELLDVKSISEAGKSAMIAVAQTASEGRTGFDKLAGADVGVAEFKENQKVLMGSQMGQDLAGRLEKFRGLSVLEGIKGTNADPGQALAAAGVTNVDDVMKLYSAKGIAGAEDIVSDPSRQLGGTSGASAAGATGAAGASAGTAQDAAALQTSLNWATFQAMKGLADRLGVK